MTDAPRPLHSFKRPGGLTADQERARIRFQERHPEVGFQWRPELRDWLAYWAVTGGMARRSGADFDMLLSEVRVAFGEGEDRAEAEGAAGG